MVVLLRLALAAVALTEATASPEAKFCDDIFLRPFAGDSGCYVYPDLPKLWTDSGLWRINASESEWYVGASPCQTVPSTLTAAACRNKRTKLVDAAAYQVNTKWGSDECLALGGAWSGQSDQPGEAWPLDDGSHPEAGVRLQYSGGEALSCRTPRTVSFRLVCDLDADENAGPSHVESNLCDYTVTWPSPHACPVTSTSPCPTPPPAPPAFKLDLAPAAPPPQQAFYNSSMWSWGGNVIRDVNGTFHMYMAAFSQGCGLSSWSSNSEVAHAVSDSPLGPFELKGIAIPRWQHNPEVAVHPDGTWLMYTIGTKGVPEERHCSGVRPSSPESRPALGGPSTGEFCQLHYAPGPDGPWTFLNTSQDASQPGLVPRDRCTNPTPWILSNGTVILGMHGRNGECSSGFYVLIAKDWRGPYVPQTGCLFPIQESGTNYVWEDPFLYFDSHAKRWRVLVHQYDRTDPGHQSTQPVGGIAYSLTEDLFGPWEYQSHSLAAYDTVVQESDGGKRVYQRRERPKLLFDHDGLPEVLYTGVCPQDHQSNCYTHAQPINEGFFKELVV